MVNKFNYVTCNKVKHWGKYLLSILSEFIGFTKKTTTDDGRQRKLTHENIRKEHNIIQKKLTQQFLISRSHT